MKAQTLRSLRQLHHYVGVLFAPLIILFALSGAFQTFRWQQESGYGGPPPRWIVWMASVHIDQARPKSEKTEAKDQAKQPVTAKSVEGKKKPKKKSPSTLALKAFVALAAVGLILSSVLGIIIALNNRATRRISLLMLGAGIALPVTLILL